MMSSQDKSSPGESRSDKCVDSPVAPVPSASSGDIVSTRLSPNHNQMEEINRAILDDATVGFCLSDLAGRITFVNDRFCGITGYSREELLGMRWLDFTHPDDKPSNIEYLEQMKRDGVIRSFEKRYIRKDGEIIWVSVGVSQRRDAGGQGLGGAAFVVDITERKTAEKALKDSEEKYRALFENSRDALITLALPPSKFTTANQSTLRMFGAENP